MWGLSAHTFLIKKQNTVHELNKDVKFILGLQYKNISEKFSGKKDVNFKNVTNTDKIVYMRQLALCNLFKLWYKY